MMTQQPIVQLKSDQQRLFQVFHYGIGEEAKSLREYIFLHRNGKMSFGSDLIDPDNNFVLVVWDKFFANVDSLARHFHLEPRHFVCLN